MKLYLYIFLFMGTLIQDILNSTFLSTYMFDSYVLRFTFKNVCNTRRVLVSTA